MAIGFVNSSHLNEVQNGITCYFRLIDARELYKLFVCNMNNLYTFATHLNF